MEKVIGRFYFNNEQKRKVETTYSDITMGYFEIVKNVKTNVFTIIIPMIGYLKYYEEIDVINYQLSIKDFETKFEIKVRDLFPNNKF